MLFHLYNLLQAILALLMPSFQLTIQIVATQHRPFVQEAQTNVGKAYSIGITRPLATAEPAVQQLRMK